MLKNNFDNEHDENLDNEHSGSVLECLTRDRGAAVLSLDTRVTVLRPWGRYIYAYLILV